MKVYELIEFLKKQPQHLDVAYCCFSEATVPAACHLWWSFKAWREEQYDRGHRDGWASYHDLHGKHD